MQYSFNYEDIRRQFLDFLQSLGIQPHAERDIKFDGELHRYRVYDDKKGQKSGAYKVHTDGWPAGFVQDWRKGIKENWRYDISGLEIDDEQRRYFNSEEYRKKCEEEHRKAEQERANKRAAKSELARQLWGILKAAPDTYAYLTRKHVKNYGLKISDSTGYLAVPLWEISGRLSSIQWITSEGQKLFYDGAELKGAFYSEKLFTYEKDYDGVVLLGEGYATMAKVHELTGYPIAAAMTCYRLEEIAKIILTSYPNAKIIITADNDWATAEKNGGHNPGLFHAQGVVKKKLAVGFVYPEFTDADEGLSDWDDYAFKYGDKKAAQILQEKIEWACFSDEQKIEFTCKQQLVSVIHELNPSVKLPPQEFVGGIFPRCFVSMLIAPPGTGKTIFVQKFVSDLSIGGNIFDGFAEDEPVRKSLILAGEAGYELLLRRGASMKWAINPQHVSVLDQYEAETKDINIMLDNPEGVRNVERLVDIYKPDILFIDTFSSFHESDENKAPDMKPIIKKLAAIARQNNMAVVPVHHSRKRAAKERTLSLNQDDVIGSSILNRLVGLIIGIEPMKDNEKVLLVSPLKSWFSSFMPFTYTLKEGLYGGTTVQTDLAPAGVNNSKNAVWFYLSTTFNKGEWFSTSQIVLSEIGGCSVADWQLRRILADFVKNGRLERRGSKKSLEYSIRKN